MPTLDWSDVVEVTHDEAKQSLLSLLGTVGFAATSWHEGDVPLADLELSAEVWARLSQVAVFLKAMALNDTSVGEALSKFSKSHYQNTRVGAITATRLVTLSCSSAAGPHTINVGDVVIESPDGPTFRNIADGSVVYPATIPSGGSLSGLVFEAEVAGSESNKGDGTVTIMVTTLAGVTVTSDVKVKNGEGAETDDRLRVRNETKWSLLTGFELTRDAVVNIALTPAPGVTVVSVDDQNPRGAGTFDVYVAGDFATAGAGDVAAIQALLDRYVMGSGAPVPVDLVIAAAEQPINITGTVYYQGAFTQAQMSDATSAALFEFIKTIPLGGFDFSPGPSHVVPFNDITDVLRDATVSGVSVKKTVVLTTPSPGADIAVASFSKVVLGDISGLLFQQVITS